MMQHTFALDLKTGTLSQVASREPLNSLTLRRGGKYALRIFATEHGSPVDLPAGHTVEAAAKVSADSANALIFSPWSGTNPVECTVHVAGTVLDGLLAVDGDATNDVESVDLAFDVLVLDGSGNVAAHSQRVTLTVENTITRGGETGPELAPLSARLIESLPAVTGLVGGGPEHLDARATDTLPLGWRVLVKDGATLRLFELAASEGEDLPAGAVLPVDFHATDNAKAWHPLAFDAAQVGLGNVPNYGVASQVEAEAGESEEKLMTPQRTAQAIAALASPGAGGANVDVQVFTESGTWTKPEGAVLCDVVVCGGGGGGGGGYCGAPGNHRSGGGGGTSGGLVTIRVGAEAFDDTEAVTVGAGGAGGASVSVSPGSNIGQPGGESSIGNIVALGGGRGNAGVLGSVSAGGAGFSYGHLLGQVGSAVSMANILNGGTGGGSADGGTPSATVAVAPTGGGGGGGATSANIETSGGMGQAYSSFYSLNHASIFGAGGAGGAGGTNGDNGTSNLLRWGTGGGGGGGGVGRAAGAGGNGGNYGGGGGGGGGSEDGFASGKGGKGGDGIVIITTYCSP
jgi:hypothetical protein